MTYVRRIKGWSVYAVFTLLLVIFFFPILQKPETLLNRNNDLLEVRSVYGYFKKSILEYHRIPLWQNRILSGSPFLGDPNFPGEYLPNYLVLILPLDQFFTIFFLGHLFLAGIGMLLLCQKLRFSKIAALFAASSYTFSPILVARLEAGHLNLLAAICWFPVFVLGLRLLTQQTQKEGILLIALAASAMFFNHLTVFVPAIFAGAILFGLWFSKYDRVRVSLYLLLAIGLWLVMVLPQLLAIIKNMPLITRDLINSEDIGPKFLSIRRFGKSIVDPYIDGIGNLGTETVLYAGFVSLCLASLGLIRVRSKYKIVFVFGIVLAIFFALGTKTRFFTYLFSVFPGLTFFRITTRHWFLVMFMIVMVAAFFVNTLKQNILKLVVIGLVSLELIIFSQKYIQAKSTELVKLSPAAGYLREFVKEPGYFRVYSPSGTVDEVYEYGKGLASGYNPVMLRNYYNFFQRAAGFEFASYAMSLPPYQTFVDKPQPVSDLMGVLGVRYVASSYALQDQGFSFIGSENGNFWYKNAKEQPRVYISDGKKIDPIIPKVDQPGYLEIETGGKPGSLVINEVYSPDWSAVTESGKRLPVKARQNIVLEIPVTSGMSKVKVAYARSMYKYLYLSLVISVFCYSLVGRKVLRQLLQS